MGRLFSLVVFFFCISAALASSPDFSGTGADGIRYLISKYPTGLDIRVVGTGIDRPHQMIVIAIGTDANSGSSLIPPLETGKDSPVWLPFSANLLLVSKQTGATPATVSFLRRWKSTQWGADEEDAFKVSVEPTLVHFQVPEKLLNNAKSIRLTAYIKDLAASDGRGRFYGSMDATTPSGPGEQVIRHFITIDTTAKEPVVKLSGRGGHNAEKVRIYQLLPRLFGNTNPTRKHYGTIQENSSGKFSDLNDTALDELKKNGFTHIWLTGVLQQATATDYSNIGEPSDDPDLLKGIAGSPYAIRDYFDVSPDYANDPAKRIEEFKDLLARIKAKGMKPIIDFVPNHVARSYHSTIRPDSTFGIKDDHSKFFDPKNNFYYLAGEADIKGDGPPLHLPTVDADGKPSGPGVNANLPGRDGLFEGEKEFGRVTGNNQITWSPSSDSWYETVKLNYGYDFTDPGKSIRQFPHADKPNIPLPDTWKKMDEIIAYWQELGVDGFRADMAHMVPPEFWRWLISRSKSRSPDVYWMAEAYDDDDAKIPTGDPQARDVIGDSVMLGLLEAGFDAVYDDPAYDALKRLYEEDGSANDLDAISRRQFLFDNSLRYAENHDESRIAASSQWGGHGMNVGRAISPLLFGLSRGPVMIYHGQEVGEPAEGAEGFGGDDARTSIFDYWSMPEFVKWVNDGKFDGGKLSSQQKKLRDFYRRLLVALNQPAFRDGDFFPLNPDNIDNKAYGRMEDQISGRWLYSYLRFDPISGQRILVVVNLHPTKSMQDLHIQFSKRAFEFLRWEPLSGSKLARISAKDILGDLPLATSSVSMSAADMENPGFAIKELPPLTAAYYELSTTAKLPPSAR